MKVKDYSAVLVTLDEVKQHPKYQAYVDENRARLHLAEIIHNARVAHHLSMKELAEKAHTTPAVISRIENAQVSAGIDVIYKIVKALGMNKLVLEF
ncbi:putative transcription factor, MBF1 like protein [Beggiatoa alba B18LD]|uniref:Putative transcription factor, MBF1 like protein n=1 Tax=Beggiatoa alba B18LD TaxID=395493 RepID=I3CID4_9GAMM|nr:helix-turn-helix transcriptional regulator [Beggiatoa alba]EIJ43377.1 putative transcription factor, MBF1 like protein [Beggiatoa alba B18LD]